MRGESGRVAERVRSLLDEHGRRPEDEHGRRSEDEYGRLPELEYGLRREPEYGRLPQVEPSGRPVAQPVLAPSPAGRPRAAAVGSAWSRLLARLPARFDPGRRSALAVGLAVLVAAAVTGVWVLAARPRALAVSSTPPPLPGASSPAAPGGPPPTGRASPVPSGPSAPPGSSGPPVVVVDVAGKVRHPGLYRLPAGSRVDDAVRAAGGPLAGVRLDSLNLAAKVVDGQQIPVGVPAAGGGGGGVAGGPAGNGGSAGTGPVQLNTATLEQLETLPGVGPVLAQHILDWRTAHGTFRSVEQLQDVSGIGPAKFAAIKGLVTL